MSDNPYRPPQARVEHENVAVNDSASKPEPKGLGGWLIIVVFGLIVTIIRLSAFVAVTLVPIFTTGQWEQLTSPGSSQYHPLWAALLLFEIVGNLSFVVIAAVLLYLFFSKSRWFPRIFIIYLLSNLVFVVGDFFLGGLIPAVAAANDPDSLKEIVRTVVSAAIWVPYMLVSKRVKNTFLSHG